MGFESSIIVDVVLPVALPGIVGSVLLAVYRAIGETMIVVMAAGLSANLIVNPLKTVTTVSVQIVTLLVGDQEFDSPKTLAAFAQGLMFFLVTLVFGLISLGHWKWDCQFFKGLYLYCRIINGLSLCNGCGRTVWKIHRL